MNGQNERLIEQALKFDPVAEAEKHGGDEAMMMDYSMAKNGTMKRLMKETNDTHMTIEFNEYCKIVDELGFKKIYEEDFVGAPFCDGDPERHEVMRVYWHDKGFLLRVESYSWADGNRRGVNSANLYYNLRPKESFIENFWEYVSSGGWVNRDIDSENIWCGYHDAREALRYTFNRINSVADPMPIWVETPYLWLANYSETGKKDPPWNYYSEINKKKIAKFPEELREMLLAAKER